MNNECQSAPQPSLPTVSPVEADPAHGAEQLVAKKHHAANRHFDPLEAGFFDAGDEQQGEGADLHGEHEVRYMDPMDALASRAVRRRMWTGLSICGACALALVVGAGFRKGKSSPTVLATAVAAPEATVAPAQAPVRPASPTPDPREVAVPVQAAAPAPTELPAPAPQAAAPAAPAEPVPAAVATSPAVAQAPDPAHAGEAKPATAPAAAEAKVAIAESKPEATPAAVEKAQPEAPPAAAVAEEKATPAKQAAQPKPDDLQQRCMQLARQRKLKDVVDVCGRAYAAGATTAEVAVTIARAEFDRGHGSQALTWARKAIERDADTADAYVYVGMAEQESGHRQAAKAAYQRYLQLAPKGRYATDLRSVVSTL